MSSGQTKIEIYPTEFIKLIMLLVRIGSKPAELTKEFYCHDSSISARVPKPRRMKWRDRPDAQLTIAER